MVAGLNYPASAGSSPGPVGDILTFTSSPEAGWTLPQHPIATYYNGYTYFSWVNGSTGAIKVASYNHSTDAISSAIQIDSMGGTVDDHNNPAILVRDSDKRLLVAFSLHNGPSMFLRVSTNSLTTDPTMTGGFAAAVNLDPYIGASGYTYPELFQLTGETNSPIYLFYRDQVSTTGRLAYSKVTDAGSSTASNWGARVVLVTALSTFRGYWAIRSNTTRIDVMMTDRDPYLSEGAVDLGHMYLDGSTDNVYKSDGTQITATKPFDHSELTQLETDTDGVFAMDGVAGTNPVFTYFLYNVDGTVTAKYARWDGSSWDKGTIYNHTAHPIDRFYGGLAINPTDAEEVFTALQTSSSTSEMYTYTSSDLGLTWDGGTAISTGSGDHNAAPTAVDTGDSTLPVIWMRGTWASSSSFSFGVRGLGR